MGKSTKVIDGKIFRICRLCKQEKSIEDFCRDKSSSRGRSYECYDCRKTIREKIKVWMRGYSKEYKANLKFTVLAIYSEGQPKCACCDETSVEFLTIDHVNNDGAKHRLEIGGRRDWGGHMIYSWLIKNGFPEGFRVLCINCNFSYGHFGYCPHQFKELLKPNVY